MIYHQSVFMHPQRLNTAMALLKEHLERVARDTECEFGPPQFDRGYLKGMPVLNVTVELTKPMMKSSGICSETEIALMEGMWATIH